jgi:ubiquinone/menaquinone biosynthesis C-methylase UbiE
MKPTLTDLIIDLHSGSERQGPGSVETTLRALEFINLPANTRFKAADLGCGSGGQTLTLAGNINASVTAVDLFPRFLHELNAKAKKLGMSDKIKTFEGSIDALPFENEEFDLIWSEGSIYNIGFEKGVKKWKDFLGIGGHLAVSEITWTSKSRPKDLEEFWTREYPEIDTAASKIKILEDQGFTLTGFFNLPESDWTESYYQPLEQSFNDFLERNAHSEMAREIVREYRSEIELYQRYKGYYSYGFYIARKIKNFLN